MSEGFVHSVKVPRLYKTAASIVKQVTEDAASLKALIYSQRHPNVSSLYALTANTLQRGSQLEELIRKTQILAQEIRLDPWLTRVLIFELLWGKESLYSECKPVLTILKYEAQLREELQKMDKSLENLSPKKKVERPRYVRINTLIMSVDDAIEGFKEEGYTQLPQSDSYINFRECLKRLGTWEFIQDFHVKELFAFPSGTKFYDHPGYRSGTILLQDKASCLPAFLLNPPPGSVVLDTCAAPGMKTTQLAAIMKNKGKIYAIERNERRYKILCDFIQLTKANIVFTINENASNLDASKCPNVEYILVDPSCSGSGMDRPEFDNNDRICDADRLKSLQSFQVFVLRHALLNFPTAKKLVYSTCSINPEENEMVIDEILANIGDSWKLFPGRKLIDSQWINYSSKKFNCSNKCLYTKPDQDLTCGFFVAVFERNFDVPLPQYKKHKIMSISDKDQEEMEQKYPNMANKLSEIRENVGNGKFKKNKRKESHFTQEEYVTDNCTNYNEQQLEINDNQEEINELKRIDNSENADENLFKKKGKKKKQKKHLSEKNKREEKQPIEVEHNFLTNQIKGEQIEMNENEFENFPEKKVKKKKKDKQLISQEDLIEEQPLEADMNLTVKEKAIESNKNEDSSKRKAKKRKKDKKRNEENIEEQPVEANITLKDEVIEVNDQYNPPKKKKKRKNKENNVS